MEFEGQYLTYEEYKALGGTLDLTPFNILEFEARKQIDLRTQNRLKNEEEIPDEVKLCVYHIINRILYYYEETTNHNITSETVGGYHITYNNNIKEIVRNKNVEIDDIITNDLYGIIINNEHLIYLGVK